MHKAVLNFCLIICLSPVYSQKNLEKVDNYQYGLTYYDGFSTLINSLSEVDKAVKSNIDSYLRLSLGNLSPSVHFAYGQVVDLKKLFINDRDTYNRQWVIPKYDLLFILNDSVLGIKDYVVQLRLDQYGQILSCTWPREGYSDKNQLKSLSEIQEFALQVASRKGFNLTQYKKLLYFDESREKMCWVFQFQKAGNEENGLFNELEVDLKHLEIVDEREVKKQTVY